jgi:hypothetical protein
VDLLGGSWDDYPSLADSEVLDRLRDALGRRRPVPGQPALTEMFDALADRFTGGKSVTAAGVRGRLGLDRETAASMLSELREALREITDPTRFELGGMVLSAEQVRAAITALTSTPGSRVLPLFQKAGHPLAGAGKTWYLAFAADVRARHPECQVPKGGHYPGGHYGGVKAALIYGMELMVGREPDWPARRAQEHMWEALRANITRLPGSTPDRVDLLVRMAHAVLAEPVLGAA